MREAVQEALAVLRHESNEQMDHSQYHQYPSRAEPKKELTLWYCPQEIVTALGAWPTK
jgi:hypothetical protein